MSGMDESARSGASALGLVVILETVIMLGLIAFGLWAFNGKQKYQNNADQLIAAASAQAVQQTEASDATKFAQQAKLPLATYRSAEAVGSLVVSYPKTWSAYVDESGGGGGSVAGYFDPNFVPALNASTSVYALRFVVVQQSFSQVASQFTSNATGGNSTVAAYALPKVPSAVGIEVTGSIGNQKNGIMAVLPIRGNTIEIWTEAPQYEADFTKDVLPNFSFSP
jgi:hypothetical protein